MVAWTRVGKRISIWDRMDMEIDWGSEISAWISCYYIDIMIPVV